MNKRLVTTLSNAALRREIDRLDPVRRVLFETLLVSRRRAGSVKGCQDDNAPMLTLLRDAFVYARDVSEPEIELAEIRALNRRVHPGAGSSLALPGFIYASAE